MTTFVLLDSCILGMVTHPRAEGTNRKCLDWLEEVLRNNVDVVVPEICDYELRRELIRIKSRKGIKKLDELGAVLRYAPVTTSAMHLAAEYWARLRSQGRATADSKALDGDVILAAQATVLATIESRSAVVATTNVGHLGRLVDAKEWADVRVANLGSSSPGGQ